MGTSFPLNFIENIRANQQIGSFIESQTRYQQFNTAIKVFTQRGRKQICIMYQVRLLQISIIIMISVT